MPAPSTCICRFWLFATLFQHCWLQCIVIGQRDSESLKDGRLPFRRMVTRFSHWLHKILSTTFGAGKLILAIWLILFLTAEKLSASAEEYDPAAVALLEKIKKENISPRFPFLWPGSDYSRWQGVTWSDERPRRLKALAFPYADYDRHQGPIFDAPDEASHLELHGVTNLECLAINVGDSNLILRVYNLPDLKILDLSDGLKLSLESLANLPNLRELNLSQRGEYYYYDLKEIENLAVLKGLQSLKLSNTKFSESEVKIALQEMLTTILEPEFNELDLRVQRLSESDIMETLREVLKSLPNLKELDLSFQALTTFKYLENLPLTSLNLTENRIQALAGLETLTGLQNLNLSRNKIRTFDGLESLTELRHLDLSRNPLERVEGLGRLTKLESLDISEHNRDHSGNYLKRLTVQGLVSLTRLKKLSLGTVYPIEEDLAPLENLEELHLNLCDFGTKRNGSRIKEDPRGIKKIGGLLGLKNLKWLDVHCLGLEYDFLPLLEGLDRFDCQGCRSPSDNSLNLKVLSRLKKLKQLGLQRNSIIHLDGLAGLDSLTHLDLSVNKIVTTLGLTDMKSLTWLNLARNQLLRLDGLANLDTLEELDLHGNRLTDLNWEEMPAHIRRLNLSKNIFYIIDKLARLTRLEELNLSENPLADFSGLWKAGESLKKLDLSKTRFNDLTLLHGFKNLESLNLEECAISGDLNLSVWPRLKKLNIKNNRITSISGWENLPEDAIIDVSCNRLPLSLLYQLQKDSRNSGRQWQMGRICGYPRKPNQFGQWDVFEPKEMKIGEILDLGQEAVLGGVQTIFLIGEPTEKSEIKRGKDHPSLDPLYEAGGSRKSYPWHAPITENGGRTETIADEVKAVCIEGQGRIIFTRPGRYIIVMQNQGIGYASPRSLFGSSLVQVATSTIIVR